MSEHIPFYTTDVSRIVRLVTICKIHLWHRMGYIVISNNEEGLPIPLPVLVCRAERAFSMFTFFTNTIIISC